jgi:hypothetical protein
MAFFDAVNGSFDREMNDASLRMLSYFIFKIELFRYLSTMFCLRNGRSVNFFDLLAANLVSKCVRITKAEGLS